MTVNPLVAGRLDGPTDALSGVWIAEDIELIAQGVKNGSWIDGSLGVVGAGLDALAFVSDPVGVLLQYGVAWIIEHVKPLSEALEWLAGDPAQIAGHAQTWRNVAASLRDNAADLDRAVRWDVTDWGGTAGSAYRSWSKQQSDAIGGLAKAAETMAAITEGAGALIAAVRILVRDAIATCVSRLITYAAEEAFSLGLATPLVVEQVSTLVASWAAKIARWLKGLLASLRRLIPDVHRLGELIDALKGILNRRRASNTAGGYPTVGSERSLVHGGHTTRPRSQIDYERQERWAGEAYDNIRTNPDADVLERNLRDIGRADESTGFTREEIEQVRRHIFFEEHPLADFDGSIIHRRYDPSPDMAEAWLRLRAGRHRPEDIALLEHELAESRFYRDYPGATYEQAHEAANRVSNWQTQVPEPTHEDYSEPWR